MGSTVGELIDHLAKVSKDLPVRFSVCGLTPTTVDSWRGVYAEPALGWEDRGRSGGDATAGELLAELRRAIDGREFYGWKGGAYRYRRSDTLHVDNPGSWTRTEICDVTSNDYEVLIHIQRDDE